MEFLKYDEDASGPDWISRTSLCVVKHTCAHLGIQNHTESGKNGHACFRPSLPVGATGHFGGFFAESRLDHGLLGLFHAHQAMDGGHNHSCRLHVVCMKMSLNPSTAKLFLSLWTPKGSIKRTSPSHFYIIDHRLINLVCMCTSTNDLWICTNI